MAKWCSVWNNPGSRQQKVEMIQDKLKINGVWGNSYKPKGSGRNAQYPHTQPFNKKGNTKNN